MYTDAAGDFFFLGVLAAAHSVTVGVEQVRAIGSLDGTNGNAWLQGVKNSSPNTAVATSSLTVKLGNWSAQWLTGKIKKYVYSNRPWTDEEAANIDAWLAE